MNATTLDSQAVRENWAGLLQQVATGVENVVITSNGQPVAALIDYAVYQALQEELEDLQADLAAAPRIQAAITEWERDPTTARPWAEIRAEWVAEGVLDAS